MPFCIILPSTVKGGNLHDETCTPWHGQSVSAPVTTPLSSLTDQALARRNGFCFEHTHSRLINLNLIGPQQHAQHCHSQSKPPPRTPHPGPTRTPSTAPKLANGSPAAAAARLGVVEVGALESGLRVDLHPSVVGDACRVCACRGLDRWGACEGEARLQER